MKKISTFFALLLVTMLFIGSSANAQVTWTGANSTNWSIGLNWNPNGVPGAADDVIIPSGTPTPLLSSAANTVKSLVINAGATLDLNGQNFASTNAVTINGTLLSSVGAATPFLQTGDLIIAGTLNATNIPTINVKGNWTRTGTYTIGTVGTVNFTGTGAQTIVSASSFPGLTIGPATGPVGLAADITVAGDLTLGGANLNANGQTITLAGSSGTPITLSGGGAATHFVAGTSTVIYQGSGTTQTLLNGLTYNNLTVNRSGITFAAGAGMTVNGVLNVVAGTFSAVGSTVNVLGNFTNTGSFSSTGAGTMNFRGTSAQAIAGVAYSGLLISNAVGVTLSGTASATNLTIAGTFIDAGNQLTGSAAGTLVFTSGSFKLGAATATTFPVFLPGTMSLGAGTVEYASAAAQTVSNAVTAYNNLVLSGAGTKTAQGALTTTNFTNTSTFADGGFTHTIKGWWVGASGTYSAGTGTVSFDATAAHTIDGSTFNNLTIAGNTVTPSAGLTVNKNFSLTGGTFVAGAFTHTINGSWSQTGGTFTPGTTTGTISFNGTGTVTPTGAFNNFAVTASGTVTAGAGLTTKNFTNAGVFIAGAFTHTVTGNWASAGTFTKQTSTVVLSGTGTLDGTSFNNLTISGTPTLTANLVSTGLTTVTGTGSLVLGAFAATGAGTFEVVTGGTLSTENVSGFNASPATTGAIQMTGRIYNAGANYTYNGTAAQVSGTAIGTGTGAGVNNLTINNAAGVTLNGTGTTTVAGTLILTSGALAKTTGNIDFIAGPAGTINVVGGSLSFIPTGSTSINVTYSGSSAASAGNELPVGNNTRILVNLTINNSAGVTLVSGATSTVRGILALTSGILTSNGALTLDGTTAATVSGGSATSFVSGKLLYNVAGGAPTTLVYPIGTENDYRPVTTVMDLGVGAQTFSAQMFNVGATPTKTLPGTLGKVSENRYYAITGSPAIAFASATGITVTLQYSSGDNVGDAANLRMAYAGVGATAWTNSTATSGSAVPTGFISGGATTVGTFVLATAFGTNNVLSVELVSFTGTSKDENISLTWTTATEHDNYGFNIERTVTGKSEWAEVGFVKGSGTSNSPKTYSFQDKVSGAASFDYRIKQTDINGLSRYIGSVVTVTAPIPTEFAISQNYPNPFNPSTIIKYAIPQASFVTLKIYNMLGQEVATLVNGQTDIGFHSITWNGRTNAGSFAASGVYIYRIVAGDFVQVKKMNLLK